MGGEVMMTRREFVRMSAAVVGGAGLMSFGDTSFGDTSPGEKSRVVSVAAEDMLADLRYNPEAVHKAFDAGLRELTGEKTLKNAWASLVRPDDVVGIKINCIAAPKVSSS